VSAGRFTMLAMSNSHEPSIETLTASGFSPASVCPEHRQTGRGGAGHRHTWTKYDPSRELYDAWESLPLIILAGLG
jgi:hypothetical protein